MSKLVKTYFFSQGAQGALKTNASIIDGQKQRRVVKFKHDGTCIVVKNIAKRTTPTTLKVLVEDCLDCEVFVREPRIDKDGNAHNASFAFLSFPSSTKAFAGICALHDRVVDGQKLQATVKKSKAELDAERQAQREAERQAYREEMRQKYKQERQQRKQRQPREPREEQPTRKRLREEREEREERPAYVIIPPSESFFDPSKSDWHCSKCKTLNFYPRDKCFKCKTDRVL